MAPIAELTGAGHILVTKYASLGAEKYNPAYLENEGRYAWCRMVAEWTRRVLTEEYVGHKIRDKMNCYIKALQPRKPARKAYDKLFRMLLGGYSSIKAYGAFPVQISGTVILVNQRGNRISAEEVANLAIEEIKREFEQPYGRFFQTALFLEPFSARVDPIIRANLKRLDTAMEELKQYQTVVEITPQNRIDYNNAWQEASDQLNGNMARLVNKEPDHWIWLGINMMGFGRLRSHNVFKSITSEQHGIIAQKVDDQINRPSPAFVQVIKNALGFADLTIELKKRPKWELNKQVGELLKDSPRNITAEEIADRISRYYADEYTPTTDDAVSKTDNWRDRPMKKTKRKARRKKK